MKFRISETQSQRPAIDDDKMDNPIAFLIKMDNVIHSMKAKKSTKNCGAHSEFLFCLLKLLPVS